MKESPIIGALGLTFKKLIADYGYPALNQSMLTSQACSEIRKQLYQVSNHDNKLKKQVLQLILNSKIVEIEEQDQQLIIVVKVNFKSEQYLFQLALAEYRWRFLSLQYQGKIKKKRITWLLYLCAFLIPLILSSILIHHFKLHYILLTQEEHNQLLQQIKENKLIQETVQVNNNTNKEEQAESDISINEEQVASDTSIKKELPIPSETIDITIKPGISGSEIAQLLYDHDLARSIEEIEQLISELNVQSKLRAGTYTLSKNLTYVELIEVLSGGL